jgi:Mrp family chromosome partitioning ATPase
MHRRLHAAGRGQVTNAINLAISFAELGRRVLIVDCDLRLPTVETKLKMKSEKGLSDLLVGECMLDDAVSFNKEHDIYVMGPGTLPADPTCIIYSKSMGNVITLCASTLISHLRLSAHLRSGGRGVLTEHVTAICW